LPEDFAWSWIVLLSKIEVHAPGSSMRNSGNRLHARFQFLESAQLEKNRNSNVLSSVAAQIPEFQWEPGW
jgi:hypothetical protein